MTSTPQLVQIAVTGLMDTQPMDHLESGSEQEGNGRRTDKANLLNIFVSPHPTLFRWYGSVGKLFFLTSQISYPLDLIVNSPRQ